MDSAPYPAPAAAGPESPPASPAAPGASPPRPLTLRQERFCQAYVLCPNAARAARRAGYKPSNAKKQGWRLLQTRRVRARLAEIQATLARDHGQDLETLIGKLEVVYRQAVEDRRATAAARAVELQARLAGVRARPAAPPEAAGENRRDTEEERDAAARAEEEFYRDPNNPVVRWLGLDPDLAEGSS